MAKESRKFSVKGFLDLEEGTITEFDKDLGEVVHKLEDILTRFNGQENVSLSLSFDTAIEGEVQ